MEKEKKKTQKSKLKWLKTKSHIIIAIEGRSPVFLETGSEKYKTVMNLKKRKKDSEIEMLLFEKIEVMKESLKKTDFKIQKNGEIKVNRKVVPKIISDELKKVGAGSEDHLAIQNFWEKLKKNPDDRIVDQLFRFFQTGKFAITADGEFIAYKKVKTEGDNLVDCHSGKYNNNPGKTVMMKREDCDSDPHATCSSGLHAANWKYAQDFSGDTLIAVKISPENVVSIPTDYGYSKLRCCKYLVLEKVTKPYEFKFASISKGKKGLTTVKKKVSTPKKTKGMFKKSVSFKDCTAKDIISMVKEILNHEITTSVKNKPSVIKRATALFENCGFKVEI